MSKLLSVILFLMLVTNVAIAEINELFGIELSKQYPVKSKIEIERKNLYYPHSFRVPVSDNYEIYQFHNAHVSIYPKSDLVGVISAERAYLTMEECNAEKKIITTILDNKFPLHKSTSYRYGDENSNRFAGVMCDEMANHPYPILRVLLVDMNEDEKYMKHLGELEKEEEEEKQNANH